MTNHKKDLKMQRNKKKELLEMYEAWYGVDVMNKVEVYDEVESRSDDFAPKYSYYLMDALGSLFFFKTNKRAKAVQMSNEIFGTNKYQIKRIVKAECR